MKSLRFVLVLFMGALALAAGIAVFHLTVTLLYASTEVKTDTSRLRSGLIGRAISCAVFAWFAFVLWQKNKEATPAAG